MTSETQNIEFKLTWRNEYLKWICGFANAYGGTIFIGKDDTGNVVDLKDSKKLLEEIPNKVRDTLGILVDVNLHQTDQWKYIEIIVEQHPYPVNYKGQYHYRSGSTKLELKGAALDKFCNSKMTEQCFNFGLPAPLFFFKSSGFWVEFRKDIYNPKQLKDLGLNDRQIKAVLFVKKNRKINNSDYQTLNDVSKATATRDLTELVEKFKVLDRSGEVGAGTTYVLIGS